MDQRKHSRMEDEHTFITKTMKGAAYGLIPGMLWGILAVEQMKPPGLIPALKTTGKTGLICAGTGGLLVVVEQLLQKCRMKRDVVNEVGGAFVAGAAFAGLRNRSISMAISGGIAFAVTPVLLDAVRRANLRS